MTHKTPIQKNKGTTPAEAYLSQLCQHAFLSMWSYPNVYRASGKELCDLLVVFGDYVIIFSDKLSPFQEHKTLEVSWKRWFSRSIQESAQQLWRAANWIKDYPNRVFLDEKCSQPFPYDLSRRQLKIHLVAVAHGSSLAVRNFFGDSGSLMLNSSLRGQKVHTLPFTVGDLEPRKNFIHILDDESLLTVIRHRDTITDFIQYLEKREQLFRSPVIISTTGEEELLAVYLTKLNKDNEHDFVFSVPDDQPVNGIFLDQGYWKDFKASKQHAEQRKHDQISYMWDMLIERFSYHALQGTQYFVSEGGFHDSERILRFMAGESRLVRRAYSENLEDMFKNTPPTMQRIRVLSPLLPGRPYYVVLLLPVLTGRPYEEYREVRQNLLYACCQIVRLKFPDAKDIVGIAMEPPQNVGGSEDACYYDGRGWTEAQEEEVRKLQNDLGILKNMNVNRTNTKEYPAASS